jgi:hypothetical protein
MTTALHHYPRRFRWSSWPSGASLYVNGRKVGSVLHFERRGVWSALLYDGCGETLHRRRCDAKRAVECAAVAPRAEESRETI